jgi:hypothetical protein
MDDLYKVSTVEEIAETWGKNPMSVRRAIDSKKKPLVGRRSGKVWIISVDSVVNRWGQPKKRFS